MKSSLNRLNRISSHIDKNNNNNNMNRTRCPITSHILDSSQGRPASNIELILEYKENNNEWLTIGTDITNNDGRCENLLDLNAEITPGNYRIIFNVSTYWENLNIDSFYPEIIINFKIKNINQHYHVPLLLSPFSYTTYRGS